MDLASHKKLLASSIFFKSVKNPKTKISSTVVLHTWATMYLKHS